MSSRIVSGLDWRRTRYKRTAASPDLRPVKSLVLLQPVLARYAFADALPSNARRGGALVSVANQVDGPVVVTYSANDQAAGVGYRGHSSDERR